MSALIAISKLTTLLDLSSTLATYTGVGVEGVRRNTLTVLVSNLPGQYEQVDFRFFCLAL